MKKNASAGLFIIVSVIVLSLSGCMVGSYQARSVDIKDSPLVNPDIFEKGTSDQMLYRYVKPGVDVKRYDKIVVDPVIVQKDGELDDKERQNYQTLANNAYVFLTQELQKNYAIVKDPEQGAMRVQMAIIDADSTKPVRNTLSTIVPIGMGLSLIKYAITGKQIGVGEITMEMKITDASTGELLGAALDRRVGGKQLKELWSSWNNADDALEYWAKRLAYVLCDMHGGSDCVEP